MFNYLFDINIGGAEDKLILGYKGAILCEMARINIPVPLGFIVTSETCTDFLSIFPQELYKLSLENKTNYCNEIDYTQYCDEEFYKQLKYEIIKHIHQIERSTGRIFGGIRNNTASDKDKDTMTIQNPLLLSVRVSTNVMVEGINILFYYN